MNLDTFTDAIDAGTVPEIRNQRQNRHTHILVLREVTAPARFTTDGETANTTRLRVGHPDGETVSIRAAELFYRKQPGAERRIAKAVQRDLIGDYEEVKGDSMVPDEMRQNSPESVLFGSAAGEEGISQRSRVYYNTAYSLRDVSETIRQNTQTAAYDETRQESTEGQGTWTHDFVKPGTMFPSVVTLDSAIAEEVLFVLSVINRTTRYGANETRGGNITNHLLGVHAGSGAAPANLEIGRRAVGELADMNDDDIEDVAQASTLDPGRTKTAVKRAFEDLLDDRGQEFNHVEEDAVQEVAATLQDDETLTEVMDAQYDAVQDYVDRFNED